MKKITVIFSVLLFCLLILVSCGRVDRTETTLDRETTTAGEDMPGFIASWWGEYELEGELLSLSVEFKENGEAFYVYGLGNSEVYESFKGTWSEEGDDRISIIMYGGPDSFDGSEADSSKKYELNGVFA